MDEEGRVVSKSDSYGMKVSTKLTHPYCCLVMDETGGETNIISGSAIAGTKHHRKKASVSKTPCRRKSKEVYYHWVD